MPEKKIEAVSTVSRIRSLGLFGLLYKINLVLVFVFLVVWIFIGIFFSFTIAENLKAMASQKVSDKMSQEVGQSAAPTETDLPGIGKVNIACVQKNVSQDIIQKLFSDKGVTGLTPEEKAKFDACKVAAQSSSSATPAQ